MRVIAADDSILLREGLTRLLTESGFDVVAQVGDAERLLPLVEEHGPDVVIVDIKMPRTHTEEGIRAAQDIRKMHPKTGALVLSQYLEASYAIKLLADGASRLGYVLKDGVTDLDALGDSIRRVSNGETVMTPKS